MYKELSRFMALIFSVIVFVIVGMPVINEELKSLKNSIDTYNPLVEEVVNKAGSADLAYISGDSVVGMVPLALRGEYDLILDGILVQEGSDVENVNFSGVVGGDYKLTIDVNVITGKTTVIATIVT